MSQSNIRVVRNGDTRGKVGLERKDKCPKCNSKDLEIEQCFFIDDDGKKIMLDHHDAKCDSCGYSFLLIDL